MNNQSQSLPSQFSNDQLQQLRRAPTLEEKDQLITRFQQENAKAQEIQQQLDEVRKSLERIQRWSSRLRSISLEASLIASAPRVVLHNGYHLYAQNAILQKLHCIDQDSQLRYTRSLSFGH